MYTLNSVSSVFFSLGSPRTDTLIIVLSGTKIGNRSHNNSCVSFHGCDLLPDIGQSEKPSRIQVSRDNHPEKGFSEGVMCCKMTHIWL